MPGHHGGPSISSGSKTKTKTKTKTSSSPTPTGVVGFRTTSSAPSGPEIATTTANVIKNREKQKKERAKKLREELDNIVGKKGTEGFETDPGIVAIPTMGKRTGKFKDIEDKLRKGEKLTGAEQVIADFYLSSAVNPYQAQIQKFKERPGGLEVFKEKFPNPLVKVARGIGDFFREGTALGKILASLKPSDKKKAEIIVDESRRQPYEVPEGIMSYEDKILRDLRMRNRAPIIPGLTLQTAGENEGIMAGSEPNTIADKKRFVEQYLGKPLGKVTVAAIERAYNNIMRNIQREASGNTEEQYQQAAYGDMSNFQPPSTEEQVVDEATGTENIFDLGSGMLSGSTSETDYMSEPTYSIPEVLDYNRPDQLRKQIDINTEDADLFTNNAFMGSPNFPAGGVESNFPEQKNMGGYMGMSTFDKLKMIADGIADNK